MSMPQLNEGQQKLVAGLHSTGPARWAIRSTVTQHAWMLRQVMVAFMMEKLSYMLLHDNIEKVKGLVVCPSSNLHQWWSAGWQGPAMSAIQFMKSDAVLAETFDVVLFDALSDYPAKFTEHLDTFLADPQAPTACFWLPNVPGDPPAWMDTLMPVLAKHRFVTLRVD